MKRRGNRVIPRMPELSELLQKDAKDLHYMIKTLMPLQHKGKSKGAHFRELLTLCQKAYHVKTNKSYTPDDFEVDFQRDEAPKKRSAMNSSYPNGKGPMLIERGRGRNADLASQPNNRSKNSKKI